MQYYCIQIPVDTKLFSMHHEGMNFNNLKHIIRTAAKIVDHRHFILSGPHAILASRTLDGDMDSLDYPDIAGLGVIPENQSMSDLITQRMGAFSEFATRYGYAASGISAIKTPFPKGWKNRCSHWYIEDSSIDPALIIVCPHPGDVFIAMMIAGSDEEFCRLLIKEHVVPWLSVGPLLGRVAEEAGLTQMMRSQILNMFTECADTLRSIDFAVMSLGMEGLTVSTKARDTVAKTILNQE